MNETEAPTLTVGMHPEPADVIGVRMNYGGVRDAIQQMTCVSKPLGCGRSITTEEYNSWDGPTRKEYTMSGWCTQCQDNFFNQEYNEPDEGYSPEDDDYEEPYEHDAGTEYDQDKRDGLKVTSDEYIKPLYVTEYGADGGREVIL